MRVIVSLLVVLAAASRAGAGAVDGDVHDDARACPPAPSASRAAQAARLQDRSRALAAAPVTRLAATACVAGRAGVYPCRDVDLEKAFTMAQVGGGSGNDVWGWTDPVTGKEWGLFGRSTGTSFIDVSDPPASVYVADLPTQSVASVWRDIKVYRNYAFVVSEAARHGMQVFDLTHLRGVTAPPVTFTADALYTGFEHAHNLVINEETGFAYAVGTETCSGGLHMIDIRDPLRPSFAGCFAADGYTHDAQCVIYRGPDVAFAGREICFCSNEDTLTIVDVTDKAAPSMVSRTSYAGVRYAHQGWLTGDQAYFVSDDEADETDLGVRTTTHLWDVRSLAAPDRFAAFVNTTRAIDHNQYIAGRRTYQSNYRAGLRILDVGCLAAGRLEEVGYFDIYPADDAASFDGSWSNYPFFASGIVVLGCIDEGFFVVRPRVTTPPPVAQASAPAVACLGDTVRLDGSGSTACPGGTRYRWLDGAGEVCPWSTVATCDVRPAVPTVYTLEVECASGSGCTSRDTVRVDLTARRTANAGPDVTVCAGGSATLDGSRSGTCTLGTPVYRWLAGATVVCPWTVATSCRVSPAATTTYTMEAACDLGGACAGSDTVVAAIDPDLVPPTLGNTLRAVKSGVAVVATWGSDPLARSYDLYRSSDRRTWPGPVFRTGLPLPARSEPDVPGLPGALYCYRAVGASCSGREGP